MIIVESPRLRLAKFSDIIKKAKRALQLVDLLSIPDVPFSREDASPCALLGRLSQEEAKRTIPVISAGHRDYISNVSMIKAYVALGAAATLIVQGDGRVSKASEIIGPSAKLIKTGAIFNRTTYASRIKAGASFFVTQLFPSLDELKGVVLEGKELYLSYFLSEKEGYKHISELGIRVPEKIYEKPELADEYIINEALEAKRRFNVSGIYLVISYNSLNWESSLEKVVNGLKDQGF